jgi:regulator of RNase E activity RraB
MSDHWDFYFFVVEDKPCSTMLDLGLVSDAPVASKPWLLSVRFPLLRPRGDGLTDNQEAEELGKIEEALVRALRTHCDAQFVGRMTWNGTRDLFFYAPRTEGMGAALGEALGPSPTRRVMSQVREDKEWQHYLEVLFPGPVEQRWMADRRVVDELKKAGDRLEHPRPIDHFATFTREVHARSYAGACQGLRFEVEARELDDGSGWSVRATRVDPAELSHVHEVATSLLLLAEEHDGKYDGWGCPVKKDTDA